MARAIKAIGIDLGTTNSVAAHIKNGEPKEIPNHHGQYLTPSAVALTEWGELLVGDNAKNRGDGVVRSFKRDMGTERQIQFNKRTYTPKEMSTLVLRQVKKDVEDVLGEPVTRAVITVPAWFSERAIVETREAGRMAGFFVLRTLSEPLAAALAYGMDREDRDAKTILVYDLGGGTFDISVLMVAPGTFAVMDHQGDVYLGGDDFDRLIFNDVIEKLRKTGVSIPDKASQETLLLACEQAKIDLSTQKLGRVARAALGQGGANVQATVSRSDLEEWLKPFIAGPRQEIDPKTQVKKKAAMELVNLAIATSHLTPDAIDHILLVGGSTYIPLVRRALAAEFGEAKILKSVNPMLCVAHGAALATAAVSEIDCPECHHKNPLEAMKCEKCGCSLIGEERIDCPVCFLPSPVAERQCWKCGSQLRSTTAPRGGGHGSSQPTVSKKCPSGHDNPLDAADCTSPGCGFAFEGGGIKCRQCQHLNEAGKEVCAECDANLLKNLDITAKSIGIKLENGDFDIIVPKGTQSPSSPLLKPYSIPADNATQLQIVVYEGENERAEENEWLGDLAMDLPPGLTKSTLVNISIQMDGDRAMIVSAHLVDMPLHSVTAHLTQDKGGSKTVKEADGLLKKAKAVAKAAENGGGPDNKAQRLVDDIEAAKKKGDSPSIERNLENWREQLARMEAEMDVRRKISNVLFMGDATLKHASEHLTEEDKKKIQTLIDETKRALDSGDLDKAQKSSQKLDEMLDSLWNTQIVVYAELIARHSDVSPSLSNKIYKALADLKSALGSGNRDRIESCLRQLNDLNKQGMEDIQAK